MPPTEHDTPECLGGKLVGFDVQAEKEYVSWPGQPEILSWKDHWGPLRRPARNSTPRGRRVDAAERSRWRRGVVAFAPRGGRVDAAEGSRWRRGVVASSPRPSARAPTADTNLGVTMLVLLLMGLMNYSMRDPCTC